MPMDLKVYFLLCRLLTGVFLCGNEKCILRLVFYEVKGNTDIMLKKRAIKSLPTKSNEHEDKTHMYNYYRGLRFNKQKLGLLIFIFQYKYFIFTIYIFSKVWSIINTWMSFLNVGWIMMVDGNAMNIMETKNKMILWSCMIKNIRMSY